MKQIGEAFERMEAGTYGICVDTGQLIEAARFGRTRLRSAPSKLSAITSSCIRASACSCDSGDWFSSGYAKRDVTPPSFE